MGKYTQGPWRVDESHINGSINAGKRHVAMANFYNCHDEEVRVTREQQKANAQLISAAPELLEFAKSFVELFKESDMRPEEECHGLFMMALSAIRKAEGEGA